MEDTSLLLEFIAEAFEHLDAIDKKLMALESEPENGPLIDDIFRSIHTIKGVSGMLNLNDITQLAHRMETLLNKYRQKEDTANAESIDVLLSGCDVLRALIEEVNARVDANVSMAMVEGDDRVRELLGGLDGLIEGRRQKQEGQAWGPRKQGDTKLQEGLDHMVKDARTCFSAVESGESDTVEKATQFVATIDDLVLFCQSRQYEGLLKGLQQSREIAETFVGAPDAKDMLLPFQDMFLEILDGLKGEAEKVPADAQPAISAPAEQEATPEKGEVKAADKKDAGKTMRIDQGILDVFMNLVGELVVSKNGIAHSIRKIESSEILKGVDGSFLRDLKRSSVDVSRVSEEMQRSVMEMRMIPAEQVFSKFSRMARDISKKLNKKFNLVVEGKDTKIDKGIAELIADPLVHLVRNSMDHGIEMPEKRKSVGKNEAGTITLSASQEGGAIYIDIIDDGGGIDPEVILRKAIEKGIITPAEAETMNKQEIIALIFAAGFSTAEALSDIAGRGVGMDVVNTNINKIGGKIIIDSNKGKGTQIRLDLPLTTAILDALLVESEHSLFAIPVLSVIESITLKREEVSTMLQEMTLEVRGKTIGVKFLSDLLNLPRGNQGFDENITVVVLSKGKDMFGVAVQKLHRLEEVVVKPMVDFLAELPGVSGASTLGDGRLILILDPGQLMELGMGS